MKTAPLMTLLTASLILAGSSLQAGVATGENAPNFTGKDADGKSHTLKDFNGKYVVLEWASLGCPFVKRHYNSGNMQALQKKVTGKEVVWLTVCSSAPGKPGYLDGPGWNAAVAKHKAHPTAVLIDEDGSIGKAFGAKTTPHLFVIGPDGKVIYQGAIDDKRSTDPAANATANNYVAAALDAAMAGKTVETGTTRPYGCGIKY